MSLSALNQPPLIGFLGASSMYAFLTAQKLAKASTLSFATLKGGNSLAYAIQTWAVSIPGRIDGEVAESMRKENEKKQTSSSSSSLNVSESSKALLPGSGRTLVAPAGWAFAIWGPIFLGEAVFVTAQLFLQESSPIAPMIRDISIPFMFAHIFQMLWSAAFRPKYKGNLMYISASLLGATAFSLSKAHLIFTLTNSFSIGEYMLYFFAMSLHFGWTTAATLVNLNGAFASNPNASSNSIAIFGHMSVIAAICLGLFVTFRREAPVYGGTIAWALFAVADGMTERLRMLSKNGKYSDMRDASRQKCLSLLGAWLNVADRKSVV